MKTWISALAIACAVAPRIATAGSEAHVPPPVLTHMSPDAHWARGVVCDTPKQLMRVMNLTIHADHTFVSAIDTVNGENKDGNSCGFAEFVYTPLDNGSMMKYDELAFDIQHVELVGIFIPDHGWAVFSPHPTQYIMLFYGRYRTL